MKLLIIGAGGVGASVAGIIKRAGKGGAWAKEIVIADYDLKRAQTLAKKLGGGRFKATFINASDKKIMKQVMKEYKSTYVLNATSPNFNEIIFDTCYEAGVGYMDCAMTLSKPHPKDPYNKSYIKLGDYQFAQHAKWKKKGVMAIVGSGVEPGMADVFAKFADKHLFDKIDEVNVRDGDNYHGIDSDFGFSVWTTIEECLNPPVIWEKKRLKGSKDINKGFFTTKPFSEPEVFDFPGGIGPVEVFNVEHEEVLLVPRVIDCNRVTFKYGVPKDFQERLHTLKGYGLTESKKQIKVGDSQIAPRDFLVKVIPDPTKDTMKMKGQGCAGTWVTGWKNKKYRSVYLYQVADNEECVKKYGTNSVVAQTAVCPVCMLELIATKKWKLNGVHGPESFDPDPIIPLLEKYEFPAGIKEMDSEYADSLNEKALKDMSKKK